MVASITHSCRYVKPKLSAPGIASHAVRPAVKARPSAQNNLGLLHSSAAHSSFYFYLSPVIP